VITNELESLKAIWRVLKPGGRFAITFLPNAWSFSEKAAAIVKPRALHNRLYRIGRTRDDFLKRDFLVEASGYHQVFPTLAKTVKVGGGSMVCLNRPLERVWPVQLLASNL
jgi:ubiquinone/menaquinone biosynthesis C-methylase UbiE